MKNLRRLACKFDRKSSQVNASARKPWPNGVASRPKFSTCVYLRVRLARASRRTSHWKSIQFGQLSYCVMFSVFVCLILLELLSVTPKATCSQRLVSYFFFIFLTCIAHTGKALLLNPKKVLGKCRSCCTII